MSDLVFNFLEIRDEGVAGILRLAKTAIEEILMGRTPCFHLVQGREGFLEWQSQRYSCQVRVQAEWGEITSQISLNSHHTSGSDPEYREIFERLTSLPYYSMAKTADYYATQSLVFRVDNLGQISSASDLTSVIPDLFAKGLAIYEVEGNLTWTGRSPFEIPKAPPILMRSAYPPEYIKEVVSLGHIHIEGCKFV